MDINTTLEKKVTNIDITLKFSNDDEFRKFMRMLSMLEDPEIKDMLKMSGENVALYDTAVFQRLYNNINSKLREEKIHI